MSSLYNKISCLCQDAGINITEMCRRADVSRGNLTDLKSGRQSGLSAKNLDKIASVFDVPVTFFLDRPPFDCWDLINQNRKGFFHYVKIGADTIRLIWGIDPNDPDTAPSRNLILFLSAAVEDAGPNEEGDWIIKLKPEYANKKDTSPLEEVDPHRVSDDEIKFALFGDATIDDDVLDEVKRFAQFAKEQRRQKEQQSSD